MLKGTKSRLKESVGIMEQNNEATGITGQEWITTNKGLEDVDDKDIRLRMRGLRSQERMRGELGGPG